MRAWITVSISLRGFRCCGIKCGILQYPHLIPFFKFELSLGIRIILWPGNMSAKMHNPVELLRRCTSHRRRHQRNPTDPYRRRNRLTSTIGCCVDCNTNGTDNAANCSSHAALNIGEGQNYRWPPKIDVYFTDMCLNMEDYYELRYTLLNDFDIDRVVVSHKWSYAIKIESSTTVNNEGAIERLAAMPRAQLEAFCAKTIFLNYSFAELAPISRYVRHVCLSNFNAGNLDFLTCGGGLRRTILKYSVGGEYNVSISSDIVPFVFYTCVDPIRAVDESDSIESALCGSEAQRRRRQEEATRVPLSAAGFNQDGGTRFYSNAPVLDCDDVTLSANPVSSRNIRQMSDVEIDDDYDVSTLQNSLNKHVGDDSRKNILVYMNNSERLSRLLYMIHFNAKVIRVLFSNTVRVSNTRVFVDSEKYKLTNGRGHTSSTNHYLNDNNSGGGDSGGGYINRPLLPTNAFGAVYGLQDGTGGTGIVFNRTGTVCVKSGGGCVGGKLFI